QTGKVVASDGVALDFFGKVSGLSSSAFLVGAYGDDYYSGSAYVFTCDDESSSRSWGQSAKVVASDGAANDFFGYALSGLSSRIFVVGARGTDDFSGSVYVFTSNGSGSWVQSYKVVASDGETYDYFGYAVSGLSSNSLVVGAQGDGGYSGSAYVFTRTNSIDSSWVQLKILASDSAASDYFGTSVAGLGSSGTFIVGALYSHASYISGSVYVFTQYGYSFSWIQSNKVDSPDGENYDLFGHAVSDLSSRIFVVGAPGDGELGTGSGSAYVFTNSNHSGTWAQSGKVFASDGVASDSFGSSVSGLSRSTLVVGAERDDDSGSAYVFIISKNNNGSWVQAGKVVASDGAASDYFGTSVSGLSNSTFVVGASYEDGMGINSGSVYVF
ncbi:unnamed protein product, partial [Heterosigma akashiwo]